MESLAASERRVLVIEDDLVLMPFVMRAVHRVNADCRVDWVTSAEEGIELIGSKEIKPKYDLILSDVYLAGRKTGMDVIDAFEKSGNPAPNLVLISGRAKEMKPYPFLKKPFTFSDLRRSLEPYLSNSRELSLIQFATPWDWVLDWVIFAVLGSAVAATTLVSALYLLRQTWLQA